MLKIPSVKMEWKYPSKALEKVKSPPLVKSLRLKL